MTSELLLLYNGYPVDIPVLFVSKAKIKKAFSISQLWHCNDVVSVETYILISKFPIISGLRVLPGRALPEGSLSEKAPVSHSSCSTSKFSKLSLSMFLRFEQLKLVCTFCASDLHGLVELSVLSHNLLSTPIVVGSLPIAC